MKTEELYVNFGTASRLKEIGFNEPCVAMYAPYDLLNEDGEPIPEGSFVMVNQGGEYYGSQYQELEVNELLNSDNGGCGHIAAPTTQQVFNYFRDSHNLEVEICKSGVVFYEKFGEDDEVKLPPKYQFLIDIPNEHTEDYIYHSADEDVYFKDFYKAEDGAIEKLITIIEIKLK
jgi:hypothetical protein